MGKLRHRETDEPPLLELGDPPELLTLPRFVVEVQTSIRFSIEAHHYLHLSITL